MAASSSAAAAAAAEAPRWDEELCVPVNKIAKVMKKALPSNGKLSKQGKELIAQCISEFISYITGEASARCQREKRMTMNGEDVIWAMSTLGFDDYVEPLKLYLFKYRQYVNCNEMPAGTQSQFFAGITRGTPAGEALAVVEREGHGGVEENSATVKQDPLAKEGTLPEENSATEEKGPPPESNSGSKKVPVKRGLTLEEETRKQGATLEENSGMKESAKQGTQLEDNSSTEEE